MRVPSLRSLSVVGSPSPRRRGIPVMVLLSLWLLVESSSCFMMDGASSALRLPLPGRGRVRVRARGHGSSLFKDAPAATPFKRSMERPMEAVGATMGEASEGPRRAGFNKVFRVPTLLRLRAALARLSRGLSRKVAVLTVCAHLLFASIGGFAQGEVNEHSMRKNSQQNQINTSSNQSIKSIKSIKSKVALYSGGRSALNNMNTMAMAHAPCAIAFGAPSSSSSSSSLDAPGDTIASALSDLKASLAGTKIDTLALLLSTALVPPMCKMAGASPILGYLLAGTLMGPNCFGLISGVHNTETLADLGIVFFLFEMGIELSTDRLLSMKKDVFGLGLSQFFTTATVFGLLFKRFTGLQNNAIVTLAGGLALSSSAFVLQLLKEENELGTRFGKASFGVLLFQDLAVVPLLVAIPLLAGGGSGMAKALTSAVVKAIMAFGGIAFVGRFILNRFFNIVAGAKNQEAFLGVTLLTVLGMSFLTEGLGLSNTLGAFLAGVLLSETKYRYQIEADVAPFRGVLLGLFFLTVGFEIDMRLLVSKFGLISGMVAGIIAAKAVVTTALSMLFGLSLANSLQTGFLLSQGGEFAFVAFGLAKSLGIIDLKTSKLFLTSVAITMAFTPALASLSARFAKQLEEQTGFDHYLGQDKEAKEIKKSEDFVVVVGYGIVGKIVCDLLDRTFQRFIGLEVDPRKAIQARNRGLPVFYGDSTRSEVCEAFNVGKAKAVVITISDKSETNRCVLTLRRQFPDLKIFARAINDEHKKRLTGVLDVTAMVPIVPEETILLTLPFGGAVLKSLGTPEEEVQAILEAKRKDILGSSPVLPDEEEGSGDEEEAEVAMMEEGEEEDNDEEGKGGGDDENNASHDVFGSGSATAAVLKSATIAIEGNATLAPEGGGTVGLTPKEDEEGVFTNAKRGM